MADGIDDKLEAAGEAAKTDSETNVEPFEKQKFLKEIELLNKTVQKLTEERDEANNALKSFNFDNKASKWLMFDEIFGGRRNDN